MGCSTETDFTFDPIEVDPAEGRKVELELFGKCAQFWRANEAYSAGEFVWPERPDGFCFEKTSGGTQRSGARAPQWPRVAGQVVKDGPIEWTCRDQALSGVSALSAPTATSEPIGLTIGSVAVSESVKILATYSGGTLGQDYAAVFTFTLNGVTRVARQLVKIRKQ